MKSFPLSFVVVLALISVHCSSTTGGDSAPAGADSGTPATGGARTGITPCGSFPDHVAKSCQAGQFCQDEQLSQCSTGCLTDNNCPAAATCVLQSSTGICQDKAPVSTVSCDTLCTHVRACAPATTAAQCAQLCAGFNDTCKTCLLNANCAAPQNACDAQCK